MTITKKAEYAIMALVALARRGGDEHVVSSEIAASQGIPANLIAQTISDLRRAGWVEAVRGPAGGVRLVDEARRATLRQVVEWVDGPVGIARCLAGKGQCAKGDACQLRGIWAEAQEKMLEVLDRVTIEDLARAAPARVPGDQSPVSSAR